MLSIKRHTTEYRSATVSAFVCLSGAVELTYSGRLLLLRAGGSVKNA